ncbi:MAG: hypothetical protein EON48_03370 [Acetobacteraceae bacterium]|nr:MAG: hypothetical protein EON48_03370 [Acetobacteraceae bacterium]
MVPFLLLSVAVLRTAPEPPLFSIEAGAHSGAVRGIAVDPQGRFMVTASDDKTMRVWELPSLRPLQVLRPPAGAALREGQLYALALSPNGKTAAVGGWTGKEDDFSIYLFDLTSGKLTRRIGGLPEIVQTLAFSPDGGRLAAGLGSPHGLRVFSLGGDPTFADDTYEGAVRSIVYDAAGRFAACAQDGTVRLYSPKGEVLAEAEPFPDSQPVHLAFSPEGDRLAVTDERTSFVAILDGKSLKTLSIPNREGQTKAFEKLAWSADGAYLYAGGYHRDSDLRYMVRRWALNDLGHATDFPVGDDSIHALSAQPGGGVAFASGAGFGLLGTDGRVRRVERAAPDLRELIVSGRVSDNGDTVRFSYHREGGDPVSFSVADRRLDTQPPADPERSPGHPAYTVTEGFKVTYWYNNSQPRLNDEVLELEPGEQSRSLALLHDASGFILGASWTLRRYDRDGRQLWAVYTPGAAWAVNPTKDGRLVVAACADGTVRWYRMSDGEELLALFAHPDRKRWVLWTPSGYHDLNEGAPGLLGWSENHGADGAAEFHPVDEKLYRPGVISRILTTLDEAEAVRLADAARQ